MNATIYTTNGEYISQGLQSTTMCDEAIQAAKAIAADRQESVVLEDEGDDSCVLVSPDGETEEFSWE